MAYFAAALARNDEGWLGTELDLDGLESLEDLAVRATSALETGRVSVLIEADGWFGIVAVSDDDDPRAYVSDAFEAAATPIGEVLIEEFGELDDDLEDPGLPGGPLGEPGLLEDVGLAASDLQMIATKTGLTPIDAIGEIVDRIGAGAVLEELR